MKKRILHIDDHEDIREVTAMLLERELGLTPESIDQHSRAEYLLQVSDGEYDVIICDNDTKSQIKGLDALALAREKGLKTPVIIYASMHSYDTNQQAREEIEKRGGLFVPKPDHKTLLNLTRTTITASTNLRRSYDMHDVPLEGLDYQI